MKAPVFSVAAVVTLALAGLSPAEAKGKARRAPAATAEKHACGGKNGCPAAGKAEDKKAEDKGAEAAPAAAKPAENK